MQLIDALKHRYTAKAYDPSRKLDAATLAQLLESLRLSPSSINSQPWHFVVAGTDEGKARIARSTQGSMAYNAPKVTDCSHVVALCSRTDLSDAYIEQLLDQEQADGRIADAKGRETQKATRHMYVNLHREIGDLQAWAAKQVYIAQGTLLLAAGLLGVDATPMEGFDADVLDAELGLAEKGLRAQVLVALGYHAETDFNARLPKSRFGADVVFTQI